MPIGPLGLSLEDGCSGSLDPQTACCELGFVPMPCDAGKITYFLHVLHRNIPFLPTSSMLVSATSEMASIEVEKMKASF